MKTIMYIVLFATIASITNISSPDIVVQEVPKTKVDSLINLANTVEKKIDKKIMAKISNKNSETDSLKDIIKRQNAELRYYKKLLKHKK